jgi:hypothetical protein
VQPYIFWFTYPGYPKSGTGTYTTSNSFFNRAGTEENPIFYFIDDPGYQASAAAAIYGGSGVTDCELEQVLTSTPQYQGVNDGNTDTHTFKLYWYGSPLAPH